MASFQELWDKSRKFRRLFLHLKVFQSDRHYDVAKAEYLWYDRWPNAVEWDLCAERGCVELTPKGDRCGKHVHGQGTPRWAWFKGDLFRYMKSRPNEHGKLISGRGDVWDYRRYRLHQGEKLAGRIPPRFTVYCVDGNPFNLRLGNLAIVSRIAKSAIDEGLLTYGQAVEMDGELDLFFERLGARGRPRAIWSYNYDDIAKAAGVHATRVRQEVSRGKVDPNNISSIVDFCNRIGGSSRLMKSAG